MLKDLDLFQVVLEFGDWHCTPNLNSGSVFSILLRKSSSQFLPADDGRNHQVTAVRDKSDVIGVSWLYGK
jgi:hypothetical protein